MTFFSVEHLTAGYGKGTVLHDLSFTLPSGCLLGVLGANASGKTTALKSICGILPHHGSCRLEGKSLEHMTVRQISRLCSYIPQRSGISIDISALDVVLMGFNPQLGLLAHPDQSMIRLARQTLELVGLAGKEDFNYLHLSEGQRQLCILARTLVSDSKLLLLDEPESALDFRLRYRMFELLRDWVSQQNRAAIVTLHDPGLALNCCDRLLLLSGGAVVGLLSPGVDSCDKMEEMLARIYGKVSLHTCQNRAGRQQLVMLKEEEE